MNQARSMALTVRKALQRAILRHISRVTASGRNFGNREPRAQDSVQPE
jgi:hypothetical protein